MRPLQTGLCQITAVLFQRRDLGVESVQRLVRNGGQLRALKGGCAVQTHQQVHTAAIHGLVVRLRGVLVVAQEGVYIDRLYAHVQRLAEGQVVIEGLGRLPQPSSPRGGFLRQPPQGLERLLPRLIAGEKVGDAPADAGVQFFSFADFLYFCHAFNRSSDSVLL